jgi:hypothetical protein
MQLCPVWVASAKQDISEVIGAIVNRCLLSGSYLAVSSFMRKAAMGRKCPLDQQQ